MQEETGFHIKSPSSLVHQCCMALRCHARKYLRLGTIIGIPEANIAQKLLEICFRKPIIIIKMKSTFVDGCFVKVIACGYHIALRRFLFGYYAGLHQKNIAAKLTWSYSMRFQGIIFATLQTSVKMI